MTELVSVIIPCFNLKTYLADCIQSVLNQTYPNIEVLVVDDESTENILNIVQRFPTVSYIRIKHRGKHTPAHAMNVGVQVSDGKYISCLGADDTFTPSYIERCVNVLRQDPKLAFVWTGCRTFGQINKILTPHRRNPIFGFRAGFGGQLGAMLVRREVYDKLSYDPTLEALEDTDFALRALKAGWRCASISAPLHNYRIRDGSTNNNPKAKIARRQLEQKHLGVRLVNLRFILRRLWGLLK